MSTPLLWVIFPILIGAILLFYTKHFWSICLIQTVICFLLSAVAFLGKFEPDGNIYLFSVKISSNFDFLGRVLLLDHSNQFTVIVFYFFLGAWSLSSFVYRIKSNVIPFGIIFIGLLIAAITVEPFLYSGLIMEIAVLISILIIADKRAENNEGIKNYLIFFTIGMAFILLSGWYLAGGEINPVNEEQLIQATVILGFGFVFWLAVFPFHTWIPTISSLFLPSNSFFILIILPIAIVILLYKYMNGFVWLRGYQVVYQAIGFLGSVMCFTGSIWSVFQNNIRKFMGYLSIYSSGLVIVSISLGSSEGYLLSAYHIFVRLINFFIIVWSVIVLEKNIKNINILSFEELFYTYPLNSIALLVALFSVAGIPFFPGYPPIQTTLFLLHRINPAASILIIISIAVLSINFIRWFFMLTRKSEEDVYINENRISKIFFGILIIISLFIGIFPNTLFSIFRSLISGYEFLI